MRYYRRAKDCPVEEAIERDECRFPSRHLYYADSIAMRSHVPKCFPRPHRSGQRPRRFLRRKGNIRPGCVVQLIVERSKRRKECIPWAQTASNAQRHAPSRTITAAILALPHILLSIVYRNLQHKKNRSVRCIANGFAGFAGFVARPRVLDQVGWFLGTKREYRRPAIILVRLLHKVEGPLYTDTHGSDATKSYLNVPGPTAFNVATPAETLLTTRTPRRDDAWDRYRSPDTRTYICRYATNCVPTYSFLTVVGKSSLLLF